VLFLLNDTLLKTRKRMLFSTLALVEEIPIAGLQVDDAIQLQGAAAHTLRLRNANRAWLFAFDSDKVLLEWLTKIKQLIERAATATPTTPAARTSS